MGVHSENGRTRKRTLQTTDDSRYSPVRGYKSFPHSTWRSAPGVGADADALAASCLYFSRMALLVWPHAGTTTLVTLTRAGAGDAAAVGAAALPEAPRALGGAAPVGVPSPSSSSSSAPPVTPDSDFGTARFTSTCRTHNPQAQPLCTTVGDSQVMGTPSKCEATVSRQKHARGDRAAPTHAPPCRQWCGCVTRAHGRVRRPPRR